MNEFAKSVRDATTAAQEYDATGGAGASADQILAREQAIAATKGLTGATKDLTQANVASTNATNTDTAATKAAAAAKREEQDDAIKLAKQLKENVSILGSSATEYEKLQAKLASLAAWYALNSKEVDIYNRAVAAAYSDSDAAIAAQERAVEALKDSHDDVTQSASMAADEEERAYQAAIAWQQGMLGVADAANQAAFAMDDAADAAERASSSVSSFNSDGSFQGGTGSTSGGTAYAPSVGGALLAILSSYGQNADIGFGPINGGDAAGTAPLKNSIDELKTSTDSLTASNRDLLSPLYNQDPRTSHIGFRSQGMADGGYVDVPGGISANDNMVAQIPVASGERIYVDAMPAVRGKGGGGSNFNISIPVTINGNASRDETARTMYQVGQTIQKQLAAVR